MMLIKCSYCTTLKKSFLIALLLVCFLMVNNVEAAKLRRNKTPTLTSATPATVISPAMTSTYQKNLNTTIEADDEEIKTATETETSITEEVTISDEKQTLATIQQKQKPASSTNESNDASSTYSVWGIVRSVWNWIRDDLRESLLGTDDINDENNSGSNDASAIATSATSSAVEGRTFGKIRRLQMALIPIIFKFGVLSAMVAFLVVLGMKTLFLLKVLIIMNAIALLGKFLTLKTNFGNYEQHHVAPPATVSWGYSNWNPHASSHGWSSSPPAASHSTPSKEIHLHIHGAQTQPQISAYSSYGAPVAQSHNGGWERRNDPYSGYDPASINAISDIEIENELNNQGPMASLPTKYPANHRY